MPNVEICSISDMDYKDTYFSVKQSIRCRGRLLDLSGPVVMGIMNLTPDSFYAGSRVDGETAVARRAEQILSEGAAIIDIGAWSSRPGATEISAQEEQARLAPALAIIRRNHPDAILSLDTFRASTAVWAAETYGVDIINDISGGSMDSAMFATVARLGTPYILMHMQGTPQDMQKDPKYGDVVSDLLKFFNEKTAALRALGVHDIIVDPGFGFGKTVEHNYALLDRLNLFRSQGYPVLAGLSRKSMIWRPLGITPEESLNGTTALNTLALMKGASILRVHDVKEAVEVIRLTGQMQSPF